jgi:hypothetical protein
MVFKLFVSLLSGAVFSISIINLSNLLGYRTGRVRDVVHGDFYSVRLHAGMIIVFTIPMLFLIKFNVFSPIIFFAILTTMIVRSELQPQPGEPLGAIYFRYWSVLSAFLIFLFLLESTFYYFFPIYKLHIKLSYFIITNLL